MLVEIHDATFGYDNRPVVRVDRLTLTAGRCWGIFGPNGVGKTTLLRGVMGLVPPLTGRRRCAGEEVTFAYLPQHRQLELNWPMSALDVACLAPSARQRIGRVGHILPQVREQMREVGVEQLAGSPFATLSGGQQQRVLLAGALAAHPSVLVLDEPTDGLDVHSRRALLNQLRQKTGMGLCTVLVSHEARDLAELADDLLVLEPSEQALEPSTAMSVDAAHLAAHVMGTHAGT